MPKSTTKPPKMGNNGGTAFVRINGKRIYLGKFGSQEANQNYARCIAEWAASDKHTNMSVGMDSLAIAFLDHVKKHDTSHYHSYCSAIRILLKIYTGTTAESFTPKRLAVIQQRFTQQIDKHGKPKLHAYAVDGIWYERTYFVHRNVGANSATVICPKSTFGKPCPICEYRATLDKNDSEYVKQINALRPQERQLFNVIVHEEGGKSEVMVLDQSRFGFGKIIDDIIRNADDEDEKYQYYTDLKQGMTLKVNLGEISGGTFKYVGTSSVEFKDRKSQYDDSWLDKTVDLDNVLVATSYEDIKDMFHGTGEFDPSNQRVEEKPSKSKSDDDEDDNDEDDSNWARTQKALEAAKKKKAAVDDDDEPLAKPKPKPKPPVDDEEDDEPPVKAKPKSAEMAKPESKRRVPIEDWDDDDDED